MLPQEKIGQQIQIILDGHSQRKDSPTPIILLVYDYPRIQKHLETLGGLKHCEWVFGLTELLAFHKDDWQFKRKEYTPSSRKRSCSPQGPRSNSTFLKRRPSPCPQRLCSSAYVVDIMEMFQTMSESGANLIRPVAVYNAIAGRDEHDIWCAGNDSQYVVHIKCYSLWVYVPNSYILQSWKGMAQGPTIDEQRAFFGEYERSIERSTFPTEDEFCDVQGTDAEAPEASKLYEIQHQVGVDKFNAGSDAGSDDEWYFTTA